MSDLRYEIEIGDPIMHPTKRGKPERLMPLAKAYELVIEHMASKCDYENDSATVATLDFLEAIYTQLRTADGVSSAAQREDRPELESYLERCKAIVAKGEQRLADLYAIEAIEYALALDRDLAVLHEEYHITRASLRSGLSEEQNVTYPSNLDKLQFLLAQCAELRRDRDAVVTVIQRVEDPVIERGDRDVHDWLAQILQVLVMDKSNAETERDALKYEPDGQLRANLSNDMLKSIFDMKKTKQP